MLSRMRATLHAVFLGLVAGLSTLAYLLPYFLLPGVWWRAIPSTIVILTLGALAHGKEALAFFGLRLSARELLLSVLLLVVGLLVFRHLILSVVAEEALTTSVNDYPLGYVHQFFQVFNDEMILRAACLTLVLRVFPYPKTVVLATAVLFSVGHHMVYRMNGVLIDWPAMLSFFSFGAIANLLFVRFGHIGSGVALHYAWNFYRFNSVYLLDGRPLSEGMTFNHVEGNVWVVTGSVIALVLTFLAYGRNDVPRSSGGGRIAPRDASQHEHARD
jgi:hypothetical protein